MDLSRDPIINVIDNGIKRDISILMHNKCYRGAITLIYAGIDALTFLASYKQKTTRDDFYDWCDKYLKVIGRDETGNPYVPKGIDFYGARCSIIHTYGHKLQSDLSISGKCCILGYTDNRFEQDFGIAKEFEAHNRNGTLVMLSILDFQEAFFSGINEFLTGLYMDREKNKENINLFEKKIKQFIHELKY
jgi:hypothetical protein